MANGEQDTKGTGSSPRTQAVALDDPVDPWAPVLAQMRRHAEPGCGDHPPTQDQRTITRRRRERERKARLIAQAEEKRGKENAVLAVAATGASQVEIALQTGWSRRTVQKLLESGYERLRTEDVGEYREQALHSLGVLHQAAMRTALGSKAEGLDVPDYSERTQAQRVAAQIRDQMNRLHAAYPPAEVDLTAEITVRREVSVQEAAGIVARLRAAQILAGEADMPELAPPAANGHAPTNGSVPLAS